MHTHLAPWAALGAGTAMLAAVLPAHAALAIPRSSASTATVKTVAGQVNAVAAGQQQLTVRTTDGRTESIHVAVGDVLVHGIPSTVDAVHAGMTVLAQGRQAGATTFIATAVRAFTPAKTTSVMHGVVGPVDQAGRMVVVETAPYETAVAYLMPGITVSGPNGTGGISLLRQGAPVTFIGHSDIQDASELLASNATVGAAVVSGAR